MDYATLWSISERARGRAKLSDDDAQFVREVAPSELAAFPRVTPPKKISHAAGFSVSGAPVGTFLRSALLLSAQKLLGPRFGGSEFYERVESDFAMRIMRSHFHGGAPKGMYCCAQCTLATFPVLEAGAIRWFDARALAKDVRRIVSGKQGRFANFKNQKMIDWALGT